MTGTAGWGDEKCALTNVQRLDGLEEFLDDHLKQPWAGYLQTDGNCFLPVSGSHGAASPVLNDPDYQDMAREICQVINRDSGYGGVWAVVWFDGGNKIGLLWRDWDGVIQIFADEDGGPAKIRHLVTTVANAGYHMINQWAMTKVYCEAMAKGAPAEMAQA